MKKNKTLFPLLFVFFIANYLFAAYKTYAIDCSSGTQKVHMKSCSGCRTAGCSSTEIIDGNKIKKGTWWPSSEATYPNCSDENMRLAYCSPGCGSGITIPPGYTACCMSGYDEYECIDPAQCADNDGDGYTNCQGDFDDSDPTSHPGAPELCDGKDNNGNVLVDEGCPGIRRPGGDMGNPVDNPGDSPCP